MAGTMELKTEWLGRVLGVSAAGPAAEGIPQGLVAYRKALLAFGRAKSGVLAEIEGLRKAIPADMPGEDGLAEEVAMYVQDLSDELGDSIDAAINAAADTRAPYTAATRRMIDVAIKTISTDELVQHIDSNPFVPVSIAKTLTGALGEIQRTMV